MTYHLYILLQRAGENMNHTLLTAASYYPPITRGRFCARGGRAVFLLATAFLILCVGCSEEEQPSIETSTLTPDEALDQYAAGHEITYRATKSYPDGTFGYLKARISGNGALGEKIAVNARSEVVSIDEAERDYSETYRARWGALSPKLAQRSAEAGKALDSDSTVPVAVWYDEPHEKAPVVGALFAISGVTVEGTRDAPPIIVAQVPPSELFSVGQISGVTMVTDATVPLLTPGGVGTETAAHYDRGVTLNNQFIHGDGIRVGIHELTAGSCAIRHEHEAFDYATVTYREPTLRTCGSNSDCTAAICGSGGSVDSDFICVDGICRNEHATEVASRVASSVDDVRFHAAEADLYIPNKAIDDSLDLVDRLEWFIASGVSLVNVSLHQRNATFDIFDHIREWYARHREMTFVKIAGNYDGSTDDWVTDCHSLNSICVGGTHASGTYGGAFADDTMYSNSKWRNPIYGPRHPLKGDQKEVERPDVVSEGDSAWIADSNTYTTWKTGTGTSYAAPSVTGLLAQQLEFCGITERSPLMNRAMLRTAAWTGQYLEDSSQDPMYPIPGFSPDSFAGAGITEAERLTSFCGGGGSGYSSASSGGGWTQGDGTAAPSWLYSQSQDPDLVVKQYQWTAWQSGLRLNDVRYKSLWSIGSVSSGARLRATFSFDTCPEQSAHSNPGLIAPAIDFDLIACSFPDKICFGVSESMDDTNEGFDVVVDQAVADLELYVIARSTAEPGDGVAVEPYAWAATLWP